MIKSLFKKHSYLLVAMFLLYYLTGCEKKVIDIKDIISKNSSSLLMNLNEIKNDDDYRQMNFQSLYKNSNMSMEEIINYVFTRELKYNSKYVISDSNFTKENIDNDFRLVFKFSLIKRSHNRLNNGLSGIVLIPCNSTLVYDNFRDYLVYFDFSGTRTSNLPKKYIAHFRIDKLEQIGYISLNPDEQQDLCIVEKDISGGMGEKIYISSNKLIYTADEINEVVSEYKALQQ